MQLNQNNKLDNGKKQEKSATNSQTTSMKEQIWKGTFIAGRKTSPEK